MEGTNPGTNVPDTAAIEASESAAILGTLESIIETKRKRLETEIERRFRPINRRNVWASQIPGRGSGCWRREYLEQTVGEQRPAWDWYSFERYEEGERAGRELMAKLLDLGFAIEGLEERFEARMSYEGEEVVYLSGKVDGFLRVGRRRVPIEVKNWTRLLYDRIRVPEDVFGSRWTAKAVRQLLSYMFAHAEPIGILWLTCEGHWKPLVYKLDDYWDELAQADENARAITRKALDYKRISDKTEAELYELAPTFVDDRQECESCWARDVVCHPELDFGEGVIAFDDPELEDALKDYHETKDSQKRFSAAKRMIEKKLKSYGKDGAGVDGALCGRYGLMANRGSWTGVKNLPDEIKKKYTVTSASWGIKSVFDLDVESSDEIPEGFEV